MRNGDAHQHSVCHWKLKSGVVMWELCGMVAEQGNPHTGVWLCVCVCVGMWGVCGNVGCVCMWWAIYVGQRCMPGLHKTVCIGIHSTITSLVWITRTTESRARVIAAELGSNCSLGGRQLPCKCCMCLWQYRAYLSPHNVPIDGHCYIKCRS